VTHESSDAALNDKETAWREYVNRIENDWRR
jgi:hypothetical protein